MNFGNQMTLLDTRKFRFIFMVEAIFNIAVALKCLFDFIRACNAMKYVIIYIVYHIHITKISST